MLISKADFLPIIDTKSNNMGICENEAEAENNLSLVLEEGQRLKRAVKLVSQSFY